MPRKSETTLEMARRHVTEGQKQVERQRRLLRGLPQGAAPKVVELMRATLVASETTLALSIAHLELERAKEDDGTRPRFSAWGTSAAR